MGDFIGAYLFGILFQFLPIMSMGDQSAGRALIDAIKADTFSLVAFEIGMFGWMAIATYACLAGAGSGHGPVLVHDADRHDPGLCHRYPANWLLVRRGIKHAM